MTTKKFSSAHIEQLLEALKDLGSGAAEIVRRHSSQPAEDSQANREQASYVVPRAATLAWGTANILIEFGAAHVSGFVRLAEEPMNIEASFTCVRSMLEACAIAAWLTDPSIEAHERAGRTYAHRYEGFVQQLKFGEASKQPKKTMDTLHARIDAVEQEAIGAGFKKLLDKKGKRCGIGRHMPSATDIIENVLRDGMTYRLLSGVAHGHPSSLTKLVYQIVDDRLPEEATMVLLEKIAHPTTIAFLGFKIFSALSRALWNQAHFCGWDVLKLEEVFEDVADKADYPIRWRFWRS